MTALEILSLLRPLQFHGWDYKAQQTLSRDGRQLDEPFQVSWRAPWYKCVIVDEVEVPVDVAEAVPRNSVRYG